MNALNSHLRETYYSSGYYHGFEPEPRFGRILEIFNTLKGGNLLDIGCGDGEISMRLGRAMTATGVYGFEISEEAVLLAKSKGILAQKGDLDSSSLPFASDFFDAIYVGEIIEHVFDPEHLLQESHRVLKRGGVCVLSTPNLAGWPSRFALMTGRQPFPMAASPRHENAGKMFVREPQGQWGHIRVMTLGALKQLVTLAGFRISNVFGCPVTIKGSSRVIKVLALIDRGFSRFPGLASRVILVLVK